MKYFPSQTLVIKKRINRRKKKKKEPVERCSHCGGVLKSSDELKNCLMCGREKAHQCNNCLYIEKDAGNKIFA